MLYILYKRDTKMLGYSHNRLLIKWWFYLHMAARKFDLHSDDFSLNTEIVTTHVHT